jgi:hypothetical protein
MAAVMGSAHLVRRVPAAITMHADMKGSHLLAGVMGTGLFAGPRALETALASRPPIDQDALLLTFLGALLGIVFVVALQTFFRRSLAAFLAWWFFAIIAALIAGAGASAAVYSWRADSLGPPSMLFLSIALGMACGLGVMRHVTKGAGGIQTDDPVDRAAMPRRRSGGGSGGMG